MLSTENAAVLAFGTAALVLAHGITAFTDLRAWAAWRRSSSSVW